MFSLSQRYKSRPKMSFTTLVMIKTLDSVMGWLSLIDRNQTIFNRCLELLLSDGFDNKIIRININIKMSKSMRS